VVLSIWVCVVLVRWGVGFVWFFVRGLRLCLVPIVTPNFASFVFTLRRLCLINLMSMKQKNIMCHEFVLCNVVE
jgi:hypothetical protein